MVNFDNLSDFGAYSREMNVHLNNQVGNIILKWLKSKVVVEFLEGLVCIEQTIPNKLNGKGYNIPFLL